MIEILISLLLFLFPLFFLPLTPEFFETGKILLLCFFNLLFLIIWLIKIIKEKKFTFFSSPLDSLILFFGAGYLLSIAFNWSSLNKSSAFMITSYLLNLIILYFVILNSADKGKKQSNLYKLALVSSGTILSLLSFILFLLPKNYFPKTFSLFSFPLSLPDFFWSPTGGNLITFSFLLILFIFILPEFLKNLKEKFSAFFILKFFSLLIITSGLFLEGYKLFFLRKPVLLPYSAGWVICAEGFKPLSSFLFGVGPGQFLTAFNRFKPVSFNQSPYWNLSFNVSANEYLQILSTIGLIGLIGLIILVLKSSRLALKKGFYALPAIIILFLFLPANLLLYFLFFVFLAILSLDLRKEKVNLEIKNNLFYLLIVIVGLIFGSFYYLSLRAYLAEVYFQKAQLAILKNQGKEAYDLEIKAIQTNPYNDNYRISYALLNLTLANNLASKKDPSTDSASSPQAGSGQALTDQEKQTVSTLLQQAVTEARNAVALSPRNSAGWENLAGIYRNLINIAQGADEWTLTALRQAINLNPTNPKIRVDLGGLFYSFKNYEPAIDSFKAAVNLKPDYANAYYNLAYSYKEKKEYQSAVAALEAVLTLVPKDSNDFKKTSADLEEFKKLLPVVSPTPKPGQPETLSLPTPIPTLRPEITPIVLPKAEEATKSGE